jgi:D-alanyl-lipoteichoic acid acyltransferase DltB (MBOAT superfamily)
MLFPTVLFAIFFVVVFLLHWGTERYPLARKWILLVASLFFYGVWSWKFALMLLASAVLNHGAAVLLASWTQASHRRRLMIITVGLNLLSLCFFKYTRFLSLNLVLPLIRPFFNYWGATDTLLNGVDTLLPLIDQIVLPVGISFFTFQALSYVLDVYWRTIPPAKTTLDFANYLSFFPQLVAGPIVRASDLVSQMEVMPTRPMKLDVGRAATLILAGLFKKMVVANWLSEHLADPVFSSPGDYSGVDILLGIYGYTLQIYCDFSAYSDIAIGTALLFGFHFPINFNAPYFAVTLQEFWRRWHISLSTWLRDYLYIPLGGSRKGEYRTKVNLLLTFLLGGLWHGAGWTFVLWGAFHGIYLSLERLVRKALGLSEEPDKCSPFVIRILGRIWIFHVVAFSWILFRAVDMETVSLLVRGIFDWHGSILLFSPQAFIILITAYLLQYTDGETLRKVWVKVEQLHWTWIAIGVAVLLTLILALAPSGVMPFIYFQF